MNIGNVYKYKDRAVLVIYSVKGVVNIQDILTNKITNEIDIRALQELPYLKFAIVEEEYGGELQRLSKYLHTNYGIESKSIYDVVGNTINLTQIIPSLVYGALVDFAAHLYDKRHDPSLLLELDVWMDTKRIKRPVDILCNKLWEGYLGVDK